MATATIAWHKRDQWRKGEPLDEVTRVFIRYDERKWQTFRELARHLVQNFKTPDQLEKFIRRRDYDRTYCWHARHQREQEPCECLRSDKIGDDGDRGQLVLVRQRPCFWYWRDENENKRWRTGDDLTTTKQNKTTARDRPQWTKESNAMREVITTTTPETLPALMAHQREEVEWLTRMYEGRRPGGVLECGIGTGKTRIALETISRLKPWRVLVFAPIAVAEDAWVKQSALWLRTNHRVEVLTKRTIRKRADKLTELLTMPEPLLVVMNYEAIAQKNAMREVLKASRWDFVVLDECHRIKAPGGQTSQYLARLNAAAVNFTLGMSGTVAPHSAEDYYAVMRAINPDILGTSLQRYRVQYGMTFTRHIGTATRTFAVWSYPQYLKEVPAGDRYLESGAVRQALEAKQRALMAALTDVLHRRPTDECVELPDIREVVVHVKLGKEARRLVKELDENNIAKLQSGEDIFARQRVVTLVRVLQITGGAATVQRDDGQDVLREVDTAKRKALEAKLDEATGERVVVFARFKFDIRTARTVAEKLGRPTFELSGATKDRAAELDGWRASDSGVLVVQPQSGAEGLDMTAARVVVFYSYGWSRGELEQSVGRVYRKGQTRGVVCYFLLSDAPIERAVVRSLEARGDEQEQLAAFYLEEFQRAAAA